MSEIIGNSGFKYVEIDNITVGRKSKKTYIKTCIIKNIKTDKELFKLIGKSGTWGGRGLGATKSKDINVAKRFLGLDNRYYYIEVNYAKVIWGQIQSSGAVIAEDRTIIKQLDFFPMNIEIPTVPVVEIIKMNIIPDTPPITFKDSSIKALTPVIIDDSAIKQLKEIEWVEQIIKQIMNQINQIMNYIQDGMQRVNQTIQSILNQLKQNK